MRALSARCGPLAAMFLEPGSNRPRNVHIPQEEPIFRRAELNRLRIGILALGAALSALHGLPAAGAEDIDPPAEQATSLPPVLTPPGFSPTEFPCQIYSSRTSEKTDTLPAFRHSAGVRRPSHVRRRRAVVRQWPRRQPVLSLHALPPAYRSGSNRQHRRLDQCDHWIRQALRCRLSMADSRGGRLRPKQVRELFGYRRIDPRPADVSRLIQAILRLGRIRGRRATSATRSGAVG